MNTPTFKVRDKRKKDWFSVENLFLDLYAKHFGAIGTAIFITLCRRADKDEKCYPSQENIGEMLGINRRTVNPYLQRLERANVINVTKKFRDKNGKWLHNVYWLMDKSVWKTPEEIISHGYDGKIKASPRENKDTNRENHIPTNNTHSNKTHKNYTHNAKQSFAVVDEIIEKFKEINPSYYKLHRNVTQRKSVERLIEILGIEKLMLLLDKLPNVIGKKYCPVITTPYELEQKLPNLYIFLQKENKSRGKGIIGVTEPYVDVASKYAGI